MKTILTSVQTGLIAAAFSMTAHASISPEGLRNEAMLNETIVLVEAAKRCQLAKEDVSPKFVALIMYSNDNAAAFREAVLAVEMSNADAFQSSVRSMKCNTKDTGILSASLSPNLIF